MLYVEDICIANYFIILKISQYPCERTEIWRFEKELKLFRQSDYLNQQEYVDDLLSLDLQLHSEDANGKRKYEKYTIPLHVISPQIKCKTYVKKYIALHFCLSLFGVNFNCCQVILYKMTKKCNNLNICFNLL